MPNWTAWRQRAGLAEPAPALAAAVRRALLQCAGGDAPVQDQLDAAELVLAAGLTEAARTLYDVAFVCMGFHAARLRQQYAIIARTGLWGPADPDRAVPSPAAPAHQAAAAVAELQHLMATVDLPPLPPDGAGIAAGHGAASAAEAPDPLQRLAARLHALLRQRGGAVTFQRLETVLAQLRAALLDGPGFDAAHHLGAPLDVLCAGVAGGNLRGFLGRHRELAYAPFGSPGLLHAAARLGLGGLGPYVSGTVRLARRSRDLLGLIQLADASPGLQEPGLQEPGQDRLERWAVLLSQHWPDPALHDLVHDLADAGLMRATWGVLERAALRLGPAPDPGLLWCLRDAGLDNGDAALAVRAQRLVVRARAGQGNEWIVLGEVEAAAGDHAAAERAFTTGLGIDPGHAVGQQRLAALRAEGAAALAPDGGYGTPLSRKLARLRRREAAEPA